LCVANRSSTLPQDNMSGYDRPTKAQLTESCNQVEEVLDALSAHTNHTRINRSRILSSVKELFTALQRLEEDEQRSDGAFYAADARSKHNLAGVLTSCGVVTGRLLRRLKDNALRHDDGIVVELLGLTADINDFLKLAKKKTSSAARPKAGSTLDSTALVEDLLRKQEKHQSEVDALGTPYRPMTAVVY
jgi:hypothetical protein